MDAERFRQIERLFHAAVALDPAARADFLAREAGNDPELRSAVTALLEAEAAEEETGVVDRLLSPEAGDDLPAPQPMPGQWIGPYRLIRELGRGGSGVVFEAEQSTPPRRVALKLLHVGRPAAPGMCDPLMGEGEILARLNHPAIATIYGAGYTDSGQPYLVMELLEGQRIDKYARRRPRGERLELFLKVCDGMEYAHRNGVIHRDLKPSNVLVRNLGGPSGDKPGDTIVKIVDFGLAKCVDPEATWTLFSGGAGGWGTLPYMSPEQRRGRRVDKRTDIYALGVMLFKLMTDELPHAVEGLPLPEVWYRLEHEPPRRPSRLDPALRGDLETIILTAMAEEPAQRYQSVAELAEDIRRYLSDRPITRRPPGFLYEWRKFARRNKLLVAAVLAIMTGLVATVVNTTAALERAKRTRAEKQREAEIRDALIWLMTDPNAPADEDNVVGRLPLVAQRRMARERLEAKNYREAERDYAQLIRVVEFLMPKGGWYLATLRGEHGECLTYLRRFEEAERELLASAEGLKAARGEDHPATREAVRRLLDLYGLWHKPEKAAPWLAPPTESTPATQPAGPE